MYIQRMHSHTMAVLFYLPVQVISLPDYFVKLTWLSKLCRTTLLNRHGYPKATGLPCELDMVVQTLPDYFVKLTWLSKLYRTTL